LSTWPDNTHILSLSSLICLFYTISATLSGRFRTLISDKSGYPRLLVVTGGPSIHPLKWDSTAKEKLFMRKIKGILRPEYNCGLTFWPEICFSIKSIALPLAGTNAVLLTVELLRSCVSDPQSPLHRANPRCFCNSLPWIYQCFLVSDSDS